MAKNKNNHKDSGQKEITRGIIRLVVHLVILLIAAGKFSWVNAWIYFTMFMISQIIYSILMLKNNAQLLVERAKFIKQDTKSFDKVFFALWIPCIFATLIISGLDAGRYGWSKMPLEVMLIGIVVTIPFLIIAVWAPVVNQYFETTIRIQKDRNQQVCDSGPYRLVRHPGYAAGILLSLTAPLILGSYWGLIPGFIIMILFTLRTWIEDRALQKELPGYTDYAHKIRYRLFPLIW